jgi:thioredoxin-related protein
MEQYTLDNTNEFNLLSIGDALPLLIRSDETLKVYPVEGEALMIIFFSSECRHCKNCFTYLEKNIFPLLNKRFRVIGVGRDCSTTVIKEYRKEHNLSIDLIPDPERLIYSKFAERSIPRIYLFNKKKKLVFSIRGYKPAEIEKTLTIPL